MSLLTHSPYSVPTPMYPCSYVGVHVCIHLPKCVYALTHACPNVHQSKYDYRVSEDAREEEREEDGGGEEGAGENGCSWISSQEVCPWEDE